MLTTPISPIMQTFLRTRPAILARYTLAVSVFAGATWLGKPIAAQDALLPHLPVSDGPSPLSMENNSFIFQKISPELEFRELKVHDIIKVLVDYRAATKSEGDAQNRKTSNFNAALTDWLRFDGKDLFPDAQSRGDPTIAGKLTSQYRANSDLELKDSLTFAIAAEIIDIQPNGNLVIEAHRTIAINDEQWQQSLTGIVRRSAIGPDRTVRSDDVADLRIDKRESGFIRDSYRRGWFMKWYDKWKPL